MPVPYRVLMVISGLLVAFLGTESLRVFAGGNFHTVSENRLYRCSQPDYSRLQSLAREYGIRTVVNLRGCCDPTPWYRNEARSCQEMDINLEDLAFSATRLPSTKAIRELLDILDNAQEPLLIHCHAQASCLRDPSHPSSPGRWPRCASPAWTGARWRTPGAVASVPTWA